MLNPDLVNGLQTLGNTTPLWREWGLSLQGSIFPGVIYPTGLNKSELRVDSREPMSYWGLVLFKDRFERRSQGSECLGGLLGNRCKDGNCSKFGNHCFPGHGAFLWDNGLSAAPGTHHGDSPAPGKAQRTSCGYSVLDGRVRFLLLTSWNCDKESLSQFDDYGH